MTAAGWLPNATLPATPPRPHQQPWQKAVQKALLLWNAQPTL
jgi:hypothetical protein